MKVILLQDVAKLGRRNSIVTVADGRGLNQLIPKGLALQATPENLKKVQAKIAQAGSVSEAGENTFKAAVAALKDKIIAITVSANEQGHMFEALKVEKIHDALVAEHITLSCDDIMIASPIKSTGSHEVGLVHGSLRGSIHLLLTSN